MPWWLWVILGVIIYVVLLLFGWSLLRASNREDRRRGYK